MRRVLEMADRVSRTDSTVLVLGETGVGKEWLTRRIHARSARSSGPFVAVNAAALPAQLAESELFGHEAGAFTGAVGVRRGAFELAHRGTLFLDEIGDMPVTTQTKLLRILEHRLVRRVGGEAGREVDTRIVAATNRDPREAITEGSLRPDLYYRLSVVTLTVPPLRARREDVPGLVEEQLRRLRRRLRRPDVTGVAEPALRALQDYDWPGNVRELINVVERALVLCHGPRIGLEELPDEVTGRAGHASAAPGPPRLREHERWGARLDAPLPEARGELVDRFERAYLERLLRATGGNLAEAGRRAGVDQRTIYNKMRRFGMVREEFRHRPEVARAS